MPEYPFDGHPPTTHGVASQMPSHDPSLPATGLSSTYGGVFVENVVALAQEHFGE